MDVALSGSLAYVANGAAGLQIVDVSNPEKPERLADHLTGYEVRRVAVAGSYACLFDDGGMAVVDASDPRNPRSRGVYRRDQREGWMSEITMAGDRAFVFVESSTMSLEVLDLSNPDRPRQLLRLNVEVSPALVPVSPQFQYIPDAAEGWLIHDVSDPGNPVRVGSHRAIVAARGGILLGNQVHTSYGAAFDVSDPAHPQRVVSNYSNMARAGNLGCRADQEFGLQCYDLSDPAAPRLIGQYAAGDSIRAVELRGTDAFVAAGRDGLQIVDLSLSSGLIRGQTLSLPWGGQSVAVAIEGSYAYVTD